MNMNKTVLLLTLISLLALTATPVFPMVQANGCDHDYVSDLWAGRDHRVVGQVLVDYACGTITVTYETVGCWRLVETHLMVVDDPADFPLTKKGNPKIGHFTYAGEHDPMETEVTYVVPVTGSGPFYIAAHAVVYCVCNEQSETAWGQGCRAVEFPGNSWALYFTFPVPT
jgi:hypothetical protein